MVAAIGCVLFLAACFLPGIGLFHGQLGTSIFQSYGDRTLAGDIPYRDFSLEYPPGSLPAFAVPSLGPADAYRSWFMGFELVCGLAVVALVAVASRSAVRTAYAALAPLALGPLVLHRYDLWATALAVAGLVGILVGTRRRLGFAALGLGTAAKLFPIVLVPLGLLYVARREGRREARAGLLAFAVTLAVAVVPFLLVAPGGVRFSVERQSGRALQIESLGSSALLALHRVGAYRPHAVFSSGSWNLSGALPDTLAAFQTLAQVAAVVGIWWLFARSRRTGPQLTVAAAAAVAAFVLFGRVLSPQYLTWLVPFVALAFGRRALAVAGALVATLLLTRAVYPGRYDELIRFAATPTWLLVARNVLLVAITAELVRQSGIASRRK